MRRLLVAASVASSLALTGCGVVYTSPQVSEGTFNGAKVRVVPLTAETVLAANQTPYQPSSLPAVFGQTAGGGSGLRGAGALPDPAVEPEVRPALMETRIPPAVQAMPYQIGIGDVLVLATPAAANSVEELTGLLAAQNRRQGYVVQDDGAISIPDVGRIYLAGETLAVANEMVFQALVENQIDPAFSLEVAEFNSQRVSIGGAVAKPTVLPIDLRPLYLNEALASAGGVTANDIDYVSVRLFRDGSLYQIPLEELYSSKELQQIRLVDGDSIFIDTEFDLGRAQAYFEEQIRLSEAQRTARRDAIQELNYEMELRRGSLDEARENFDARMRYDAVDRDYVYMTGELKTQRRFPLPFDQRAVLADAVFEEGGIPTINGDLAEIYVIRGEADARDFSSITAWQLNAKNAASLLLATRFELRPNDIIFVAEQPITSWNRVISQMGPGVFNSTINSIAQ
ncbi:polysaccharide biosynthesis/export family protein [Tropicimonas marinistellae]|uniref:polysaccharide biosynthesis/export family protein n=1 Tax=Tropicimonas marinistellae TaxID=1739787 RepID=UPI00098F0D2C|nr:polysaccharide biosynthesis/export family protein [Tropicimonas marinistellae]